MPTVLVPLVAYLHTQLGRCSGISFIDSTPLAVCHNARIHQHRVFAGRAARGKTSVGWFYGFKLHLVVNDAGEQVNPQQTPIVDKQLIHKKAHVAPERLVKKQVAQTVVQKCRVALRPVIKLEDFRLVRLRLALRDA